MKSVVLVIAVFLILFWSVIRERAGLVHTTTAASSADTGAQSAIDNAGLFAVPGTQLHTLNPDILAAGLAGNSGTNSQALFYGGSISTGG